ncbi:MAG: phospholipase D-like domain-containing protein, partial [Candidatus Nitrotoga sp.]
AGVVILWFRPWLGWLPIRLYQLRRLHRKLALIDERLAFVSSMNINDAVPPGGMITEPRLDYTVQVQGHVVEHIQLSMQRLWTLVSWVNFRRRERRRVKFHNSGKRPHHKVIFLARDNFRHRHVIEQAYMAAIMGAKTEIIIANAYFLPGKRLRRALCEAAVRGVRVQLLLQGQVEYRLQHYATLALYDELLGAGIEIHEYHVSFLHAKVAMVDGIWSTVGSSNIDPLSLWMAREANLVVYDKGFADSMRQNLMYEIAHGALPVQREKWRQHGIFKRLMMHASYALVRLLIGFAGYARGHDNV